MFFPTLRSDRLLRYLSCLIPVGMLLASCGLFGERKSEKPLARAYDTYLYPSDISGLVPAGSTSEDSAALVKSYIELWLKRKAVMSKAEYNLTADQKDLDKQIEEYRTALLIYEYEKLMIEQKLDTVVTQNQIESYYHQYSQNFLLQDPIIKGVYFRLLSSSSRLREFRNLANSSGEIAYQRMVDLGDQIAEYSESYEADWISFTSIMQIIPGSVSDPKQFLQHYKNLEADDGHYFHFLKISAYMLPGEIAPLEYVRSEIRDILLNKRKIEFLKEIEEDIYNESVIHNEVEVYEN